MHNVYCSLWLWPDAPIHIHLIYSYRSRAFLRLFFIAPSLGALLTCIGLHRLHHWEKCTNLSFGFIATWRIVSQTKRFACPAQNTRLILFAVVSCRRDLKNCYERGWMRAIGSLRLNIDKAKVSRDNVELVPVGFRLTHYWSFWMVVAGLADSAHHWLSFYLGISGVARGGHGGHGPPPPQTYGGEFSN